MNHKNWNVSVAVVCVVLGVLLALQFRLQVAKNRVPVGNSELMVRLYNESIAQEAALSREAETLRMDLRHAAEGKSVFMGMNTELEKAQLLAGSTAVRGPGIVVTIDSPAASLRRGEKQELFLVHDEDLLNVVNELVAAGAEAVAINGERRVGSTEIRRAGSVMSINNRTVGEPFVISAIGNPEMLSRSLSVRGGVLDALKAWGITVKLEQREGLLLPAMRDPETEGGVRQ